MSVHTRAEGTGAVPPFEKGVSTTILPSPTPAKCQQVMDGTEPDAGTTLAATNPAWLSPEVLHGGRANFASVRPNVCTPACHTAASALSMHACAYELHGATCTAMSLPAGRVRHGHHFVGAHDARVAVGRPDQPFHGGWTQQQAPGGTAMSAAVEWQQRWMRAAGCNRCDSFRRLVPIGCTRATCLLPPFTCADFQERYCRPTAAAASRSVYPARRHLPLPGQLCGVDAGVLGAAAAAAAHVCRHHGAAA